MSILARLPVGRERPFSVPFHSAFCHAIVVLPFVYYAYLLNRRIRPVEYPDAFAYLWHGDFNLYYLTGRSLTQRIVYTTLGNQPQLIANLQLGLFLALAVAAHRALRGASRLQAAVAAVGTAFVCSSYTLNLFAGSIAPEPIHIALLLLFHLVLFAQRGPRLSRLVLPVGILFVFSRTVAPYVVCAQVALFLLVHWPRTDTARSLRILGTLVALSAVSITITAAFDTSLDVNVANNLYTRVFPDRTATQHFHENYGMPTGPFVAECRGGDVNSPCIEGRALVGLDWQSRNYVLVPDRYGLVDWIRQHGRRSWIRYLPGSSDPTSTTSRRRICRRSTGH